MFPCPQPGCLTKARSPGGCAAHRVGLEMQAKEGRIGKLEDLVAELVKRVDSLETQLSAAQESMADFEEEFRGKIAGDFATQKKRQLPPTPRQQPSS